MKTDSPSLKQLFEVAETNAKKRDDAKTINLALISKEDKKAEELGYGIFKLRKKNPSPFIQSNSENLYILISSEYLTDPEWNVASKIQVLCEMNTNAIIDPKTKQFMSVSKIADFLKRDRTSTSKIINELLRKRILYEIANAQEIREFKRPVTERPLFMNPELFYAGDRNQINAILSKICIQSDILEKKGIKLPWKVWYDSGAEFGKLITRKSYLEKIKEAKIKTP